MRRYSESLPALSTLVGTHEMTPIRVRTRQMDKHAMESLLARHHVGRMAFSFHDRISLALVNYVYADEWLYARLTSGPELTTVMHHQWVAFAVDEIAGIYDWRAVTVHGSAQLLSEDKALATEPEFQEALARLRSVVPSILTPDDPMPERVQLIRIHVDAIEGREALSRGSEGLPPA